MSKYIHAADITTMLSKEEAKPNGNLETVIDYILELENSGLYSLANICSLKSAYYRYINDEEKHYFYTEQAAILEPKESYYHFMYSRELINKTNYTKAISHLNKIIETEKQTKDFWYTSSCMFFKAICYYYLKDYQQCYEHLKDLPDDCSTWIAGGLHSKKDMMDVLKGFGYN